MTGPEDTSQRPPEAHLLGLMGGSDAYITGMEAAGQRQVVASDVLPADGPWAALTEMGFVKGDPVDDLFVTAQLPAGWTKEGSDHAMHSYIADERGVQRVNIFYKAAFYDRKADMHLMNPGHSASTEAIYGDQPPALPAQWDVFTAEERADFAAGLDRMADDIRNHPDIYVVKWWQLLLISLAAADVVIVAGWNLARKAVQARGTQIVAAQRDLDSDYDATVEDILVRIEAANPEFVAEFNQTAARAASGRIRWIGGR